MNIERGGLAKAKAAKETSEPTAESGAEKTREIPADMLMLHMMWRDMGERFVARTSTEEITPQLIRKEAERFKPSFNKMREYFLEDKIRKADGKPGLLPTDAKYANMLLSTGNESDFRMRIATGFAYLFARKHGITLNSEVGTGQSIRDGAQRTIERQTYIGLSKGLATPRTRTETLNDANGTFENPKDWDLGNSSLYEIKVRDEFLQYMDEM
jgi:hypothetical protein